MSKLTTLIKTLPGVEGYINTTSVVNLDVSLLVEDVIKAGLISTLNVVLHGEKGRGKTQLMRSVNNQFFNSQGTAIRAHPDLRIKDLYEDFKLESMEMTLNGHIDNLMTEVDEINRAPALVQNEIFNVCDGYINFKGRKVILGKGFHVVLATANIGTNYNGTFAMDDALKERFHLTLDMNNYPTKTLDNLSIVKDAFNPRPKDHSKKDLSDKIQEINGLLKSKQFDLDGYVALLYIMEALDYCQRSDNKSKLTVIKSIPSKCHGCNRLGKACGYISPSPPRVITATKSLAAAFRAITDAKTGEEKNVNYNDVMEAAMFTIPYSGLLNTQWVVKNHNSNELLAAQTLKSQFLGDIMAKKDGLVTGLEESMKGHLRKKTLDSFKDHWAFYGRILDHINTYASENGSLYKKNKTDVGGVISMFL